MPLQASPDCQNGMSDRAAACPHCGCPNSNLPPIELTSKKIKLQSLIASLLSFAGMGLLFTLLANHSQSTSSFVFGSILTIGGLAWLIGSRTAKWWHHE